MRLLETQKPGLALYHADALELCAALEPASIDLILTDPPYYRVKDEPWDRQWDTAEGFLAWVGELCVAWRRVLKPNGSLYVFASPQMAARVECVVRESFNVLNRIRWVKDAGWHQKTDEETLRSYLSPWEEIVFAEQWGADHAADDVAGYGLQCHFLHKQVFAPLGQYLSNARERAGLTRNDVEVALGYVSTADPSRGTALCCRWEEGSSLPTEATYARLQTLYRSRGSDLPREYEALRREYEALRVQFEALRQEYETLRRPFQVTEHAPYDDVWNFPTVQPYPGKHPCEKPRDLLQHIITTSSREGATVLDCFMGSGSTGEAALSLGRQFIGGDASDHWSQYAFARLERKFGAMPVTVRKAGKRTPQPSQEALAL